MPYYFGSKQGERRRYLVTKEEIFDTMRQLIAEQFAIDAEEIRMDSSFVDDLGADSVDLVELVMAMEEEFEIGEIREEELQGLRTVGDCVNYLASKLD
jgi:acyl carrier protein